MLWTKERPQPPDQGAVSDRLWEALKARMTEPQSLEFETARVALKAKLEMILDKRDAMPDGDAKTDLRMRAAQWCHTSEVATFNAWARRLKFDWYRWEQQHSGGA